MLLCMHQICLYFKMCHLPHRPAFFHFLRVVVKNKVTVCMRLEMVVL
jgi:hypothetical protein